MAFGLIAAALSIGSSIVGAERSSTARRRSRRADNLEAQRATIANVKARRAAMASLRRQQAQQVVATIANGTGGSSGDRATASSIASQGLSELGYNLQQDELGGQVNTARRRANRASTQAGNAAGFGQLVGAAAQLYGGTGGGDPALPVAPTPNPHIR